MDREIMIQRKSVIIMKTAEEILNEVLVDVENRPVFFREQDVADLIGQAQKEAFEIAFKEGQSNPKIKQLEWKENHFDIIADTLYGKYIVSKPVSGVAFILYLNNNVINASFNLDEAKDFAQKDFEIRIKECLTTE